MTTQKVEDVPVGLSTLFTVNYEKVNRINCISDHIYMLSSGNQKVTFMDTPGHAAFKVNTDTD